MSNCPKCFWTRPCACDTTVYQVTYSDRTGGPERPDWMNTPPEMQQIKFLLDENATLKARIAELEEQNMHLIVVRRWIPVTELLPLINQKVLVWINGELNPIVAYLGPDSTWCVYFAGSVRGKLYENSQPAHWMSLPAPPAEGE